MRVQRDVKAMGILPGRSNFRHAVSESGQVEGMQRISLIRSKPQPRSHVSSSRQGRTLAETDMIVSILEAAEIGAVIPDEFLMQAICWNLATYGYVRVQVAPKDYDSAVAIVSAQDEEV